MFNNIFDRKTPSSKFHGMYRGVVVSNKDPLEAGRCQVKVFSVYDGVTSDHLPWAQYADPFMGGAIDSGGFFIPDEGTAVWVFFENGDFMTPVYFAGAPAKPHFPSEKSTGEYPKNRVFKSKGGHIIELDDTEGSKRIKISHAGGASILIDNDSNMTISGVNNMTQEIGGDATINVTGTTNLTTSAFNVMATDMTITSTLTVNGMTTIVGGLVTDTAIIGGIPFISHKHPNGTPTTGTPVI